MQVNTKCLSARALGVALLTLAFAAPSAWAYTAEPGWVTNNYFAASVESSSEKLENGAWLAENKPSVGTASYSIDSTQSVFEVTAIKTNDFRKIIRIDADMDISDNYYDADLDVDAPSVIAGIALTPNENATNSVAWYVLDSGNTWTKITSTVDTDLASYIVRTELDYTSAAAPLVRYSVKKSGASVFTVLEASTSTNGWFAAKANADSVKDICFCGKTELTSLTSTLGTTAAAEVDYVEKETLAEAMTAAGTDGTKKIVLYKDGEINLKTVAAGTYDFNKNGKTLSVADVTWTSSDVNGKVYSYLSSDTITFTSKPLVAKILKDSSDVAYMTLQEAFNSAVGNEVILIANVSENAASSKNGATLNLAEKTISKGTSSAPILSVTGGSLIVTNGTIMGATGDYAAIKVSGAGLTLDDIVVTNNETSIDVVSGGTVTILGGVYANAIKTDDGNNSAIAIKGGYLVAKEGGESISYSGNVKATAGKVTDTSKRNDILADSTAYKYAAFAVNPTVGGYTLTYEIVTNNTASGDTKVWNVQSDSSDPTVEGVQIPDEWVNANTTGGSTGGETTQNELKNGYALYGNGDKVKKWEAYVLGIDASSSATTTKDVGPCVKGVQDTETGKVSFRIVSPDAIRAKESGCDVKFQVEEYTDASLSEEYKGANTSDKVDYTEKATIALPADGKVRYYKLIMSVTPAK